MSDGQVESDLSKTIRRTAGILGIAGLALAVIAGSLDYSLLALTGMLTFGVVPSLTFMAHLVATRSLTGDEKRVWRGELWMSHRLFVAQWAYLFTSDLKARTKGFAPYKGG